jgi:hypothetical protein
MLLFLGVLLLFSHLYIYPFFKNQTHETTCLDFSPKKDFKAVMSGVRGSKISVEKVV